MGKKKRRKLNSKDEDEWNVGPETYALGWLMTTLILPRLSFYIYYYYRLNASMLKSWATLLSNRRPTKWMLPEGRKQAERKKPSGGGAEHLQVPHPSLTFLCSAHCLPLQLSLRVIDIVSLDWMPIGFDAQSIEPTWPVCCRNYFVFCYPTAYRSSLSLSLSAPARQWAQKTTATSRTIHQFGFSWLFFACIPFLSPPST